MAAGEGSGGRTLLRRGRVKTWCRWGEDTASNGTPKSALYRHGAARQAVSGLSDATRSPCPPSRVRLLRVYSTRFHATTGFVWQRVLRWSPRENRFCHTGARAAAATAAAKMLSSLLLPLLSAPSLSLPGCRSPTVALRTRTLSMAARSQEDAESNARLVDALFEDAAAVEQALEKSKDVSSHLQLELDADGKPVQLRFAYVDERECIGCTYCASIARNTFFMEEDAGRARVFAQGDDDPEVVMEAIDCCPAKCANAKSHHPPCTLPDSPRGGLTPCKRLIPRCTAAQLHLVRRPRGPRDARDRARRRHDRPALERLPGAASAPVDDASRATRYSPGPYSPPPGPLRGMDGDPMPYSLMTRGTPFGSSTAIRGP